MFTFTSILSLKKEAQMRMKGTSAMEQRYAAVIEAISGNYPKIEIADRYNISRQVLDKWIKRFTDEGINGLCDRSSKPLSSPHETDQEIVDYILQINEKYRWLAKKIFTNIKLKKPEFDCPSISTIHRILERADRTHKYRIYNKYGHPGKPVVMPTHPNHILSADYKGQFNLLNGAKCYPLTITCNYSRMLLGAFAHTGPELAQSKRDFHRVFSEYGLPDAILTDNGTPFVGKGIAGLSQLNVWWTELGIQHIRTQLKSPYQNGKHERMHREMKREVTRPPGHNINEQSQMLEDFRRRYNEERGHGGIGDQTPISQYVKSERKLPNKIREVEYPDNFAIRKVSDNGGFRWENDWINLSQCLGHKYIGMEEIDDGLWKVYFYERFIGFFDEIHREIKDNPKKLKRNNL